MRAIYISNSITHRDGVSLDRYFNDIKKIRLLSAGEEIVLASRIKNGETEALKLLVTSNLRFVVSVAKQYQNRGVSISDLINEGNLGLISAAKRFDEKKGFKFISFAVWSIRQAILVALIEQSRNIHIPYNQISLIGKVNKSIEKLEQAYARKVTTFEVAEHLGLPEEKTEELMKISGNETSLDKPLSQDIAQSLIDVIPSAEYPTDYNLINDSKCQAINFCLSILKPRERSIIVQFFGLNRTEAISIDDIAKQLDMSTEHTRRLKDKALVELRNSCHAQILRTYLNL
jgi:RNA polymerase primary sigma factor